MKKSKSWLTVVIILTVLSSLTAIYMNQGPLPAYIDQPSSEPVSSAPALPEMKLYLNEELSFSFSVPVSWENVKEGNSVLFIAADGTRLSLETTEYHPQSNMVTQQGIKNEIAAAGGEYLSFQKTGNNSYLLAYQIHDTITVDYVIWDRTHECRLCFVCRPEDYETYQPLILAVFDSCKWASENAIPDPLLLYYEPVRNFEFGFPTEWSSSITSGTFISRSPGGAVFTVSIAEDSRAPENISQIQYAGEMSSSHMDFYVKNYVAGETQITAEAVYSQNDTQMFLYQHILFRSGYRYTFSLDFPAGGNTSDIALFRQCLQLLRFF